LANTRDRAEDVASNGVFEVGQFAGVIEICTRPTPLP